MALPPLDFPASPAVGQLYPPVPVTGQPTYKWDGAQWLSYAAASLPTPTKPDNYGKKNYIINGAMMVSQENGTTAGSTSGYYAADTFATYFGGTTAVEFSQQIGFSPTPGGSPNRYRVTCSTADATVAAGDWAVINQNIEGLRSADLRIGTASAKTVTLQFGVKAPAGTYCVAFQNNATNRSYVAEYVIAVGEANTDVVKSISVTLDTTGTWLTDNGVGLRIYWALMSGATTQAAPGGWFATAAFSSPNQFNFMGTINNVFELFDVSLTEGTVAPPFQVPDYADELLACQRYFKKIRYTPSTTAVGIGYVVSATDFRTVVPLIPPMRIPPTLIASAPGDFSAIGVALNAVTAFGGIANTDTYQIGATTAGGLTANAPGQLRSLGTNATLSFNARL